MKSLLVLEIFILYFEFIYPFKRLEVDAKSNKAASVYSSLIAMTWVATFSSYPTNFCSKLPQHSHFPDWKSNHYARRHLEIIIPVINWCHWWCWVSHYVFDQILASRIWRYFALPPYSNSFLHFNFEPIFAWSLRHFCGPGSNIINWICQTNLLWSLALISYYFGLSV